MHKFRNQLLLTYLPLALLPVLVIGLITRGVAENRLTLLVTEDSMRRRTAIAPCLSAYYATYSTWTDLATHLENETPAVYDLAVRVNRNGNPRTGAFIALDGSGTISCIHFSQRNGPSNEVIGEGVPVEGITIEPVNPQLNPADGRPNIQFARMMGMNVPVVVDKSELLITDLDGTIVVSGDASFKGQTLTTDGLAQSAPIFAGGSVVGRVILGMNLAQLDESSRQLLSAVNTALLLSGAASVLAALGLGWWMASRIAAPIRALTDGVRRLGRGDWSQAVPITTSNEFGDLTRAFNHMASELMRQQQMNRQMVADIAHDLRTPLAAMSLEVEAIEAGLQIPEDAAPSLREEIIWLQRMVEDLRLLSLMDADQIKLQREAVNVPEFMHKVYDFWQITAEDSEKQLTINVPSGLPIIHADPSRLRQVLNNLIDNALRHTPRGRGIKLEARNLGAAVQLSVRDEGEGIAPDALARIFDRFYRVDPARKHEKSGSGLGLSIAKRLVEMHGGQIQVESTLGQGTTFLINLPV
ncbi:MAG: hypothetical protein OHK0023_27920 [Anaerolineae bacterium]